MDPRHFGGQRKLEAKMYEFPQELHAPEHGEIGERRHAERKEIVRGFIREGAHFYGMWKIRRRARIEGCAKDSITRTTALRTSTCTSTGRARAARPPRRATILGELAEPIGMTDYEGHRLGAQNPPRRVRFSFICIPPGSAVM